MIQVLTPKEVGEMLKVSERTIIRIISSGQLSAAKINKQWRIEASAVQTYFKNRSITAYKTIKHHEKDDSRIQTKR